MMTTSRGSYSKGRARRQEIIDVALDLFAQKGYDRTSVREIARLTGLSQAGLLHHFGTKEELFIEVLRQRDLRNESHYEEVDDTGRVSIEGLAHIVDHNAAEPGLVRLYVAMSAESTDADSAARRFFIERYDNLRRDLATDIRRRQEAGELDPALDPDGMATVLLAAADGLQIQWLLTPDSVDMGARLADLVSLLSPQR